MYPIGTLLTPRNVPTEESSYVKRWLACNPVVITTFVREKGYYNTRVETLDKSDYFYANYEWFVPVSSIVRLLYV